MITPKLLFFDIDHTLFDTRLYLENCFTKLAYKLQVEDVPAFIDQSFTLYKEHRKTGTFRSLEFLNELFTSQNITGDTAELEKVFFDEMNIKSALYSDVEEVLQTLNDKGYTLGIFSYGLDSLQRPKINSLLHVLEDEHIHITQVNKVEEVKTIIEKYRSERICIIDDIPTILQEFKSKNPNVMTILIDRKNKYSDKSQQEISGCDFTLANLREMLTIIQ